MAVNRVGEPGRFPGGLGRGAGKTRGFDDGVSFFQGIVELCRERKSGIVANRPEGVDDKARPASDERFGQPTGARHGMPAGCSLTGIDEDDGHGAVIVFQVSNKMNVIDSKPFAAVAAVRTPCPRHQEGGIPDVGGIGRAMTGKMQKVDFIPISHHVDHR